MDSSDTQLLHPLNDDELSRFVSIAIDEFGPDLPRTQFNDVMLAFFEYIAGLETIPTMDCDSIFPNFLPLRKCQQASPQSHATINLDA